MREVASAFTRSYIFGCCFCLGYNYDFFLIEVCCGLLSPCMYWILVCSFWCDFDLAAAISTMEHTRVEVSGNGNGVVGTVTETYREWTRWTQMQSQIQWSSPKNQCHKLYSTRRATHRLDSSGKLSRNTAKGGWGVSEAIVGFPTGSLFSCSLWNRGEKDVIKSWTERERATYWQSGLKREHSDGHTKDCALFYFLFIGLLTCILF